MNPTDFLARWREAGPAERANKDSFLAELCDVLGVERPLPKTNDPEKDRYVFEKDVARSREDGTSIGRIDLFRAGCFVLEAKQVDAAKRGIIRWLRPEFQNPQGKKDAVQGEIPGTAAKKAKKSAKTEPPAKTEKRSLPKEPPQQEAAVPDLLAEAGALDLGRAKAAFKGAKDDGLAASLDSLAALGLAVAAGTGPARSWSAVR